MVCLEERIRGGSGSRERRDSVAAQPVGLSVAGTEERQNRGTSRAAAEPPSLVERARSGRDRD
jgi:hypothetical protein